MKESTASYIAYDLRPAKQAERRILLDFLKCANEIGVSVSDCRYVGMGGTKYYDFHLFHRFLGVNRMTSLERNPKIYPRADFNCPYDFIDVRQNTVAEFLASDSDKSPTIYWFDYDDGLSEEITADILSLGSRLTVGGFAFVTVCANPPGVLANRNKEERLEHFQQSLGEFSVGLTVDDMENSRFPSTVHRIVLTAFKNAFAARPDAEFEPLFQIQYRDTAPMITVGGCLNSKVNLTRIRRRMTIDMPFMLSSQPYYIRNLNLTERERLVFDMAVTKRRSNSKQANALRSLGFKKKDIEAYRDLIRFLPRYHESII
jgi:hypothetical protein